MHQHAGARVELLQAALEHFFGKPREQDQKQSRTGQTSQQLTPGVPNFPEVAIEFDLLSQLLQDICVRGLFAAFHKAAILSQGATRHLWNVKCYLTAQTCNFEYPVRRQVIRLLMANILYGVNGEGAGHSSRSREVLTHLQGKGHKIHVASFDRGLKNLAADFEVTEIYGLRLAYSDNRVRYAKTVLKNLFSVPRAAKSVRNLIRLAENSEIQLVITDFEPVSCHLGHKLRLPVLSIDNQHCLIYGEISYPRQYRKEAAAAKMVSRMMTPQADAYFVTSFFTPRPKNKHTFFFPRGKTVICGSRNQARKIS